MKCSKESGGKRLGTSSKKIGNAPLKWAFSEAAPLFLRHNPQGQSTELFLGRRDYPPRGSAIVTHVMIEPQYVFGAATSVGTRIRKLSQDTGSTADAAGINTAEKIRKSALRSSVPARHSRTRWEMTQDACTARSRCSLCRQRLGGGHTCWVSPGCGRRHTRGAHACAPPEAIEAWVPTLRTRCTGPPMALCLARTTGPCVAA